MTSLDHFIVDFSKTKRPTGRRGAPLGEGCHRAPDRRGGGIFVFSTVAQVRATDLHRIHMNGALDVKADRSAQ
jgi:hypothetical protein